MRVSYTFIDAFFNPIWHMPYVQRMLVWIVRLANNSLNVISDPNVYFHIRVTYMTHLNKLDDHSCILHIILVSKKQKGKTCLNT